MPPQPLKILRTLAEHEVEFIVIGGVAAVLRGAPIMTLDLDIVHSREEANVARLVNALAALDAYYREHPDWRPVPDAKLLSGKGHHLLETKAGRLDVLCVLSANRDYNVLLPHSDLLELGEGLQVRVLSLPMLIELKEEIGREKDRAVLPVLRATLSEQTQKQ